MKIIKPYHEIMTPIDGVQILKHIENCGRICYKSEHKITEDSYLTFAKNIVKRGHEAVIEHCSLSPSSSYATEVFRTRLCDIVWHPTVKNPPDTVITPKTIFRAKLRSLSRFFLNGIPMAILCGKKPVRLQKEPISKCLIGVAPRRKHERFYRTA